MSNFSKVFDVEGVGEVILSVLQLKNGDVTLVNILAPHIGGKKDFYIEENFIFSGCATKHPNDIQNFSIGLKLALRRAFTDFKLAFNGCASHKRKKARIKNIKLACYRVLAKEYPEAFTKEALDHLLCG